MKKLTLLLAIISLFTLSCEENKTITPPQELTIIKKPEIKYKTVITNKIIKDLKEIQEQSTSYHNEVNLTQSIWDGDLKTNTVPNIHTTTTYYIIYTDHTTEETSKQVWLTCSKGDTIKKYNRIAIN